MAEVRFSGVFHAVFTARAQATPDVCAIACDGVTVTYGELDARANGIARLLIARGLRPGQRVVAALPRGTDLIASALGIWKAGGVYLPIDVEDTSARAADIIAGSGAAMVVGDVGTSAGGALERVDPADAADYAGDDPGVPVGPGDPAYVIHTSGSSGRPKGVVVGHAGLANLIAAQRDALDIGPGDRVLQFAAATFDASIAEFTLALANGAILHVPTRDALTPGEPLATVLARDGVTHAILVPSVLARITPRRFSELRVLGVAGEECPADLVRAWAGDHPLLNLYGVTECSVWSTYARTGPDDVTGPGAGDTRVPIGLPVRGTQVRVVDEGLRPVAAGTPGELLIGGAGVAHGYLDRPELTAERFVTAAIPGDTASRDALTPADDTAPDRWYRTGDLVCTRTDGQLEFLGRIDDQVQIRGRRIEPGEIEAALTQLADVRQAAVVAHRTPGGEPRLVAYVVAAEGTTVRERDVRTDLASRLPAYLVPSAVVALPALPLTPHGKTDRKALAALAPASRPEAVGAESPAAEPPAATGGAPAREAGAEAYDAEAALEGRLAVLIARTLELPRMDAADNFFDHGGDSLAAADLLSHVQREYGVHLSLGAFFMDPTAEGLARQLADASAAAYATPANPAPTSRAGA
ncbi:MAG: non-ribosomal peptide synthetase [Streptomycetaceae bacterium]|nr:non-ribosomal peptide synthetase [Streptomycetaceae bacterium]